MTGPINYRKRTNFRKPIGRTTRVIRERTTTIRPQIIAALQNARSTLETKRQIALRLGVSESHVTDVNNRPGLGITGPILSRAEIEAIVRDRLQRRVAQNQEKTRPAYLRARELLRATRQSQADIAMQMRKEGFLVTKNFVKNANEGRCRDGRSRKWWE